MYLTREYRARRLAVSYLSSPRIYEPHLTNLTAALLIVPHPLGQVNGSLGGAEDVDELKGEQLSLHMEQLDPWCPSTPPS